MQGTCRHIRHHPARARLLWGIYRWRIAPALESFRPPERCLASSSRRHGNLNTGQQGPHPLPLHNTKRSRQWAIPTLDSQSQLPEEPTKSTEIIELGQSDNQPAIPVHEAKRRSLRHATSTWPHDDVKSWERIIHYMRRQHGDSGVWEVFRLLREKKNTHILVHPEAELLRQEFLTAALDTKSRITEIVQLARSFASFRKPPWPGLYVDVLYHLLGNDYCDDAVMWHLRLAPEFPPETEAFKSLLTHFATDPSSKMQTTLTTMYIFSTERRLYDHIVPALYSAGRSKPAMTWRKTLIQFGDLPLSSKPLPFFDFLQRYYPLEPLIGVEKDLLKSGQVSSTYSPVEHHEQNAPNKDGHHGIYTDSIVAKWFASSWTSVDFAINLVHSLGVRSIGPRSLQSLALRETDAEGVRNRKVQLQKLGLTFSDQVYSKAVFSFAKLGDDRLLTKLLHCDIHPDEFEDVETRRMLLTAAIKDGDENMQQLLESIETLANTITENVVKQSVESHHNSLLLDTLSRDGLVKARLVLDRMEALEIEVDQEAANCVLRRAFRGIKANKRFEVPQASHNFADGTTHPLDRALATTRQLARMGVAIRLRDWQALISNLGWSRRLRELEQLSLEIVELYDPQHWGLNPVHQADVPGPSPLDCSPDFQKSPDGQREASRTRKAHEVGMLIPADLHFSHPDHPVRKIFDASMQRRIARWGFDKTMSSPPEVQSTLVDMKTAGPMEFDVACGVRLLAMLKDRGVLIDTAMLRSFFLNRIVLAQLPWRGHHRRDSQSRAPEALKRLIDTAWGSEILPKLPYLEENLEQHERRLWKQYPRLYDQNYDEDAWWASNLKRKQERRLLKLDDGLQDQPHGDKAWRMIMKG